MIRRLTCILAAAFLSAGLGCNFLQHNDSSEASISHPVKTADSTETTGELHGGIEADPAMMTLSMKKWSWLRTVYNNDTIVVPLKPGVFTLIFNNDDTVSASTDCNRMRGSYTVDGRLLSFNKMAATRMFCPDSQETVFADMLTQVSSFLFTAKGELILELKYDSGQMVFK